MATKKWCGFVIVGSVVLLAFIGIKYVIVSYRYEREISGNWSLAEKASTIKQKSEYIDKFIDALDKSGDMYGNNALVFPTPDNDLTENMKALRSLQGRLHEIQTMDIQSFAYQQAIQQITAQEQGEATGIKFMIEGGWYLHEGYWYLWDWVGITTIVVLVMSLTVAVGVLIN